MFGLGWTEILVIATIAILVVPPKDLPGLMRNVGRWMGKARRVMRDFQREIEDAARVDELPQIRRQVEQLTRRTNDEFMRDLKNAPTATRRTPPPAPAAEPTAPAAAAAPSDVAPAEAMAEAGPAPEAGAPAPVEAPRAPVPAEAAPAEAKP